MIKMPRRLLSGDESILIKPKGTELGWRKVKGRVIPFSSVLGVGQYFTNIVKARIRKQKPCNVIFVGEPGISKTYSAISVAQSIEPKFSIRQVVMEYPSFMRCFTGLREGQIIIFDEPEYSMGHRDWYRDRNKALVSTMRSGRFKVHPVFMPVINKSLLDKVVREHLIQYMVWMKDKGEGIVYRVSPSQFTDDVYTNEICKLYIQMLDSGQCKKTWCFSCVRFKMDKCDLLRAQYEHKRQKIQDKRYAEDLDLSVKEEARKIPFSEWLDRAYEHFFEILYTTSTGKERISTEKIELVLGCSQTMSQRIRSYLNQMTKVELAEKIKAHRKSKPKV